MICIMNTLLFLGTGSSQGIPMIGCACSVCTSSNPKNQRLRPSVLLTLQEKKILVDSGPDLRLQALRYGINHLDGVIITHTHYDHIGGLDELRSFYLLQKKPLPLLLSANSYQNIERRLPYLFQTKTEGISLPAQLTFQILEEKRGESEFLGLTFRYLTYEQGGMEVNGLRYGSFAYISDIRNYPDTIFSDLNGVKTLVVSALRKEKSWMHFTLAEAVAFAEKVGAEKTYLIHMAHELEHESTNQYLPQAVQLAYDGLEIVL